MLEFLWWMSTDYNTIKSHCHVVDSRPSSFAYIAYVLICPLFIHLNSTHLQELVLVSLGCCNNITIDLEV